MANEKYSPDLPEKIEKRVAKLRTAVASLEVTLKLLKDSPSAKGLYLITMMFTAKGISESAKKLVEQIRVFKDLPVDADWQELHDVMNIYNSIRQE